MRACRLKCVFFSRNNLKVCATLKFLAAAAHTLRGGLIFIHASADDLLHAPDQPALQADLDAVWVRGRIGQDRLDDALGQLSAGLILFLNNADAQSGFDVRAALAAG